LEIMQHTVNMVIATAVLPKVSFLLDDNK
jgi:hypothetical protein